MLDFLTSGYGLGGVGLIGIILFLIYMKLMKWIFKITLFGVIIIGAFWYFKSAAGS